MQTLAPPNPIWPGLSSPLCEQTLPGSSTADEQEGKIGTGQADLGAKPQPLQGGADSGEPESQEGTGSEGDGT